MPEIQQELSWPLREGVLNTHVKIPNAISEPRASSSDPFYFNAQIHSNEILKIELPWLLMFASLRQHLLT